MSTHRYGVHKIDVILSGAKNLAFLRARRCFVALKMNLQKLNRLSPYVAFAVSIFLAFFLSSCQPKSDKDLILELMEKAVKLAEKRDIDNLLVKLTDDYSDFEGRDKSKTRELLVQYFEQYKGIVIHILSTRFDELDSWGATIQTEMAVSSGGAEVLRKLIRFAGETYRFKIQLQKTNRQWQVRSAGWHDVGLEGLFPESLSVLQKLFPKIF